MSHTRSKNTAVRHIREIFIETELNLASNEVLFPPDTMKRIVINEDLISVTIYWLDPEDGAVSRVILQRPALRKYGVADMCGCTSLMPFSTHRLMQYWMVRT